MSVVQFKTSEQRSSQQDFDSKKQATSRISSLAKLREQLEEEMHSERIIEKLGSYCEFEHLTNAADQAPNISLQPLEELAPDLHKLDTNILSNNSKNLKIVLTWLILC